ncbi:MAG: sigma 54-interacting transcriptional regulator [Myxococcaceae bacterium]|nr:sigma 54-interacting transcriptional regulator [Myxococcaceae bacterium]MCI0669716.1 sigma 54-interacting transcriptional regulator [Myxococcaceae bacterium]
MHQATVPITAGGPLLRLDASSGTLRSRLYRLRVLSGPDAGRELALTAVHTVGSHPDAALCLSDPTVSRYHLELEARSEGVRVRDLDSTNGTHLAGSRVQAVVVEDEAVLTVGRTQLRITVEEEDLGAPQDRPSFGGAVGHSPAMRRLFGVLGRVAPTDSTVLLLGETGTGKEVLAEAIHKSSARAHRSLVVVDCGAVAPSLIESELFGHTKGAFTGAVGTRPGAFLEADGGTLFLDEIGELPLELQPKLLRVLEAGTIKRVGEDKSRRVNVRVVAATHRELQKAVEEGRFRRDLYYRLAVVPVVVPPLRERLEDLPLLAETIVRQLGRGSFPLSAELLERFSAYGWPGNVRELRNVIERALSGAEPTPGLPAAAEAPSPGAPDLSGPTSPLTELPFKEAKERLVESFTREYLQELFTRHAGNVSQVARAAGLARNHVYNLVTKYALDPQGE